MSDPPPQHAVAPPFQLQTVMSELYHARDLLDFSPIIPTSPNVGSTLSSSPSTSILSSATSMAAAAGRRAAAVAAAAGSPSSSSLRLGSPDRNAAISASLSREGTEVRCVEGYGPNLYIGGSDGIVEWWVCDGASGQEHGWSLRHKHTLFPKRPVSRIVLLPKLSKAFILSDGTLHPLTLPSLDPIPSSIISPLRGVVSVVLDDDELDMGDPGNEDRVSEMTVVIVRRSGLGIYRLGTRMDLPLPSAPTHHALFSNYLCAAIPSTSTNSVIDLSDASLTEVLPVSQIDTSVLEFDPNPNIVVIPGENEFLVTSCTGPTTMGVFLNGQGDPERGAIEWAEHPLAIDLELIQTVTLDPSFGAFTLSYSPYGVAVRDTIRDERMAMVRIPLLGPRLVHRAPTTMEQLPIPDFPGSDDASPEISPVAEEPPSGSGLTPPSSPRQPITPARGSSLRSGSTLAGTGVKGPMGPFSTATAETLVVGPNGIMALSPTPVVMKLEKLCSERRLEEAIALVDEERRKGRRGEVDADKVTHAATLRLLHIYLALHLFLETMFDRAGDYFIRGKVDARLLVRLYPSLRGKTIGSAEEVEVFEGLREILEDMGGVDEIISTSIQRNYSPHMRPDTRTAPEAQELRNALEDGAKDMLTDFLRKTRASRRKGGGSRGIDSRKIDIVIDTTLAKLLAEAGTTNELLALLAGPNDVVLSELEPFLAQRKYILSSVMRKQGKIDRVLALLQEIAEDPVPDPLCLDPVDEFAQQLENVKDPELFKRCLLWLIARDEDKGLAILIAQNVKTGVKLDDASLVDDLRGISESAANKYLEHVVVTKRSPNRQLHEALLGKLLDMTIEIMQDEGVKYHLEELDSEYKLQTEPAPFPVFLADVAPDTPIKTFRLKLMLFLQGSPFYDLQNAAERLTIEAGLKPELAIVLGRLGRNRQALQLLAREIQDPVSAQTYCTQGGEIIPPKVARAISKRIPSLEGWATLGEVGRGKRRGTVDASTQEGLVMELLGAYMRDGASTAKQTAALLNAQSVHLDVLEVLTLVPPEWPLDVVSSFLQRSLRRQLHDQATWQILKAISAGQNLETSAQYLETVSSIPPIIVPNPSPGSFGIEKPDEGSIAEKEYGSVNEKRELGVGGDESLGTGGYFDLTKEGFRDRDDSEAGRDEGLV